MSEETSDSFTTDLNYQKIAKDKNAFRIDVKIEGAFTYQAIAEVLVKHLELLNEICKINSSAVVITVVDFGNVVLKTNFWEMLDLRNEIIANFTHYNVRTILVLIKGDRMSKLLATQIMEFITNIIDLKARVDFYSDRSTFDQAVKKEFQKY